MSDAHFIKGRGEAVVDITTVCRIETRHILDDNKVWRRNSDQRGEVQEKILPSVFALHLVQGRERLAGSAGGIEHLISRTDSQLHPQIVDVNIHDVATEKARRCIVALIRLAEPRVNVDACQDREPSIQETARQAAGSAEEVDRLNYAPPPTTNHTAPTRLAEMLAPRARRAGPCDHRPAGEPPRADPRPLRDGQPLRVDVLGRGVAQGALARVSRDYWHPHSPDLEAIDPTTLDRMTLARTEHAICKRSIK